MEKWLQLVSIFVEEKLVFFELHLLTLQSLMKNNEKSNIWVEIHKTFKANL